MAIVPAAARKSDSLPIRMDRAARFYRSRDGFSGMVAVSRNHQLILQRGYGYANRMADSLQAGYALPHRLHFQAVHCSRDLAAPAGWKAEDKRLHQPLLPKLPCAVEQHHVAQSSDSHLQHSRRRFRTGDEVLPAHPGRELTFDPSGGRVNIVDFSGISGNSYTRVPESKTQTEPGPN